MPNEAQKSSDKAYDIVYFSAMGVFVVIFIVYIGYHLYTGKRIHYPPRRSSSIHK